MRFCIERVSDAARVAGVAKGDVVKVTGPAAGPFTATHNGQTFRVLRSEGAILCPKEGCRSVLSRFEVSRGYQCGLCTAQEEGPL